MNAAVMGAPVAVPELDLPVTAVIPHRAPFVMIDRVVDADPGRYAVSTFRVREDDPVFEGHFPGFAVMPGVLLVENMAQTACWVLAVKTLSQPGALYVLARINQCSFKQMARPGDQLTTRAQLSRDLGQFALFDCQVHVGTQLVAEAELLVARRAAPTQP